jgi:acyl transferase domain-containing protein/aryl carrier-like protein
MSRPWSGFEIAVVGMAARLPGAPDVDRYWRNLCEGVESVTFLEPEELDLPPGQEALRDDSSYVRAAPILDGVEWFDAEFFGFSAREAEATDPQQRLLLECAWEALENAGYDPAHTGQLTGLYAGALLNDYLWRVRSDAGLAGAVDPVKALLGNEKDYLASRVAYKLNLEGPAVTVQTACSTSLVAVHLACQALLSGDCDLALAGGVAVQLPQRAGYRYREGEIFSPDGHCRAFDAKARGTVFGSGLGLVVLRRLADALEAGDTIRAVILGSAINNDGLHKVGFTAPRAEGQARVIRSAQVRADVDPATITLLEAHGTGTPMGDPIEVQALTRAFRAATDRRGFCALGSVKTNVGHLNTAAGIAGLVKVVLALEREQIPPVLHFEQALPALDLENSPFFVPTRLMEWRRGGAPRRAGVSSFGIGGTNAHVVLEEAPLAPPSVPAHPAALLTLSARSPAALGAMAGRLAGHLETHPDLVLEDVASTLHGRTAFPVRWAAACGDRSEALAALTACREQASPGREVARAEAGRRPVFFLFPGQGAQRAGMTAGLYRSEPGFRKSIDQCAEILRPLLGGDLREWLYPAPERHRAAAERLTETWLAQPALFAVEHALASLWMRWGVQPQGMIGHSIGEYVAACLAGVFSLEDGLRLVAARGRLMQRLPGGAMLSVPLAEEDARALAQGDLSLAAVNGPRQAVLAGPEPAIAELEESLARQGVAGRRLATSHAFHSSLMEPAVAPLAAQVAAVQRRAPEIPFLSNLTGGWISAEAAIDPEAWGRQLRETVRFGDGLDELLRNEGAILLEAGPGRALSQLALRHPARGPAHLVVSSLGEIRGEREEVTAMLSALGTLWTGGVEPNWHELHAHECRRRVPLPSYPFERQRFWVDGAHPAPPPAAVAPRPAESPERRPLDEWFSIPSFRRVPAALSAAEPPGRWLLLTDALGIGDAIGRELAARGHAVTLAVPGTELRRLAAGRYALDPSRPADFDALLAELLAAEEGSVSILHLWTLAPPGYGPGEVRTLGFGALVLLAQALGRSRFGGREQAGNRLHLLVVSNGLEEVTGDEELIAEKSLLLGPVRCIPHELPAVGCRLVDVVVPEGEPARAELARRLLAEALAGEGPPVVACRGRHRWVQTWEPVRLDPPRGDSVLRQRGVYVITGGFGGLGFTLALELAASVAARLVLIGRSPVPPDGTRDRQVQELEARGAEVLALAADVTRPEDMGRALAVARERFGRIHGVLHAAGVPGGSLLQGHPAEPGEAVLNPKVAGAQVLWEALAADEPDFVLLFSSTLAMTGAVGQVDYCAANAFLDAFARVRAREGAPVVAVGWDAWEEVGMAAAARRRGRVPALGHSLLGERLPSGPGPSGWEVELSTARQWEVAEHRLHGRGLVPATALLEMMAAALVAELGGLPVVIEDFAVTAPLWVDEGAVVTVRTVLERRAGGLALSIWSRGPERALEEWREHAVARGRLLHPEEPRHRKPLALGATFQEAVLPRGGPAGAGLDWGPRWESLRRVVHGPGEAVGELAMPEAYAAELAGYVLHPALLDVATSFALPLLAPGPYVPLAYHRLTVHGRLPSRVTSRVKRREGGGELASFDLEILDPGGEPLLEAEGVTFRRLDRSPPAQARETGGGGTVPRGIRPHEGVEAFLRLLRRPDLPNVVVATGDLEARRRRMVAPKAAASAGLLRGTLHARPAIATPYVAPRTAAELSLAEIWRDLLGFEQVGVDDNFFEMGGDSLLGVQFLARVAGKGLSITIGQLFQNPTIAGLAALTAGVLPAGEQAEGGDGEEDGAFTAAELSREELENVFARFGSAQS